MAYELRYSSPEKLSKYVKINKELQKNLEHNCKNETTMVKYQQTIDRFSKWVYETQGTYRVAPEQYKFLAQEYLNSMVLDKSPHTLHTYKQHLALSLNINGKLLQTPKRGAPEKGRDTGKRTEINSKIYDIATKIGIRKAEYGALKGRDFVEKDGHLYVIVEKGKGGKEQYQLIKDEYKSEVLALKNGIKDDQYILDKDEKKSLDHAGTHDARRAYAREMYEYFRTMPETEKAYWREEMHQRFLQNPKKAEKDAWGLYQKKLENSPILTVRGVNKERCLADGKSPNFDREAVMMVSVFCLSHYREQVTIENYLVY